MMTNLLCTNASHVTAREMFSPALIIGIVLAVLLVGFVIGLLIITHKKKLAEKNKPTQNRTVYRLETRGDKRVWVPYTVEAIATQTAPKKQRKTKEERNSSMRRIKYLFLLQTGDKWRAIREGNKKALAFRYFLATLGVVAITAGLTVLLNYLKSTYQFGRFMNEDMLTTVLFVTQIFGIVSCTASMMNVLYLSRENNMLLAFPCHYNEIFVSKILVFSVEEFKKSFFFVLPFLVAFGIAAPHGVAYWVMLVPAWLMLCFLPVLIGATVSIGAIYVKRFLDKHI